MARVPLHEQARRKALAQCETCPSHGGSQVDRNPNLIDRCPSSLIGTRGVGNGLLEASAHHHPGAAAWVGTSRRRRCKAALPSAQDKAPEAVNGCVAGEERRSDPRRDATPRERRRSVQGAALLSICAASRGVASRLVSERRSSIATRALTASGALSSALGSAALQRRRRDVPTHAAAPG